MSADLALPSQPKARPMWIAMVAKLTCPMEPERGAKALMAMLPMLGDLPDAAFCPETARDLAANVKRLPTYGEVRTVLDAWAWKQRERQGLARLPAPREADDVPAARQEPTADAREHVANLVRAFTAERSWQAPRGPEDQRVPVKPCFLSTERLIVEYEKLAKQGNRAAVIRLEMLRAKLEQERADV